MVCAHILVKGPTNESVEFSEEGRVGVQRKVIMIMGVGGYTEGRSFKKVIKKSMRGKKLTGNRKECRKATNGLFLGFLHLSSFF